MNNLIKKIIAVDLLILLFTLNSFAKYEERQLTRSDGLQVCAVYDDNANPKRYTYKGVCKTNEGSTSQLFARQILRKAAQDMPTGNSPNAFFLSKSKSSKKILKWLILWNNPQASTKFIDQADYVAGIVQNNDESEIHYFTIKSNKVLPVGDSINQADFYDEICDSESKTLHRFKSVSVRLLNSKYIEGQPSLEDFECY